MDDTRTTRLPGPGGRVSNPRPRRFALGVDPAVNGPSKRFGLPTVTSIPPGATEQLWLLAANAPVTSFLEIPFGIPIAAPLLPFRLELARAVGKLCLVELLRDVVRGYGVPEVDASGAPRPRLDVEGAADRRIRDRLQDLGQLRRGHPSFLGQARYLQVSAAHYDITMT